MPAGSILRFSGTRAARDRYLSDLKSIYGTALEIPDPDYALLSDPEIYQKMERDPVIYSALDFRLKSVIGQTWHCEPPSDMPDDKAGAAVVEELLSGIANFQQARLMVFRGALLMGRGYAWIRGARRKAAVLDGQNVRDVWLPSEIQQDDKRRFQYVPVREPTGGEMQRIRISQDLQYFDLSLAQWVELSAAHRRALITMTYNDRADRLGMGQGLGVPLYHWFRQKALAWRDWAQASERWAQGIVAMKLNQDRPGSKTNEELRDDALDTLDEMRSRNALVYGDGEEVQVFETSGTGQAISADQIEKIDRDIIRLLSGSVRPMGGDTDTGARAQSETEQDSSDVIVAYDRSQLDEAMTETLVRCVWELNRPALISMGLARAKMPSFATSPEKREDPQRAVTVISQALGAQIPLRKVDVYSALGFQQPAEDDEVFEGAPAAPPGGGGLPFHFAADWDESKHKRDGGKFAPKEGAGKGEERKKPARVVNPGPNIGAPRVVMSPEEEARIRKTAEGAAKQQRREIALMPEKDKKRAENVERVLRNQPEWVEVKGVKVMRVGDSPFLGVPHSDGRQNSKKWDIINIEEGEQTAISLSKAEMIKWLVTKAIGDEEDRQAEKNA